MDIHYNKFKVTFHRKNTNQIEQIKFYEDYKDIPDNEIISIEENRLISLKFQCGDKFARLYMDGLDTLPLELLRSGIINLENNEVFIKPSDSEIPIYNEGFYPLIPGQYGMKVVIDGKEYYSLFKVINKLLTEDESNIIKRELENEINGIAFDFIRRSFSVTNQGILNEMPIMYYKFSVIDNEFDNIINSLIELQKRANYKISNKYKIVRQEKVRKIDHITIKGYLSNSVKQGFMKVPIKGIEYNLLENRWVKKIVKEVIFILNKFSKEIDRIIINKQNKIKEIAKFKNNIEVIEERKSLEYINQLKVKVINMKGSIISLSQWNKELGENIGYNIPHVLIQDSRYNTLYRVYKRLHNNNFSSKNDNEHSIQWKKTDKLYEMWCYIKICKIIKDSLGYKSVDGWIFNQKTSNNNYIVQDLNSGTLVSFGKDDIKINLYYDCEIPKSSNKTSFYDKPIYITAPNNKPDGRLDVYKNDIYLGSIIFEFKYRYRENIWYKNYDQYYRDNSTIRQLVAYDSSCKSIYTLKKYDEQNKKMTPIGTDKIRPIQKVIVLYPKSENESLDIDNVSDHNLRFIKIKPEKNIEKLEDEIKNQIKEILDREEMREFYIWRNQRQ